MGPTGVSQIGTNARKAITGTQHTRWNLPTLILFRFVSIYLLLFSLNPFTLSSVTQGMLHTRSVVVAVQPVWIALLRWTATKLFRLTGFDPSFMASDSVLGWSQVGLFALIAFATATVWSIAERNRQSGDAIPLWFRFIIRIVLALTLVDYGAMKIWPAQMPIVRPHQLLGELGSYTPQQLLWAFMGASPGYERFSGCMELFAGGLLFVPQLTTLGVLLATVALTQVFALNVFYDVQVKMYSFNLLLMALFLLVPDARRLMSVFLFNRATEAADRTATFRSVRVERIAVGVQLLLGMIVVASALMFHHAVVPVLNVIDTNRVPNYGVWDVEDFSLDGAPHLPLLTDGVRWQRIVFDDYNSASIERMNGAIIVARLLRNGQQGTMTLTYAGDPRPEMQDFAGPKWRSILQANTVSPDSVLLQGEYNQHPIKVQLRRSRLSFALQPNQPHWMLRQRPVFSY
jgi:hypothetical protein